VADARVINSVIEKLIMENPTQYLWLHRRYKNRPDGRLGMYPPYASIS
jgi:KDO2-lipid IV(A) lauroyltransferase